MALSFASLQQLQQLLEDAGVSASPNPEDINTPGAWLTVAGINQLTVAGDLELQAVVYLIAGDTDYLRAHEQLAELFNIVVPAVLSPDGLVVPQGVVLPGSPTVLPALRVPVNLT